METELIICIVGVLVVTYLMSGPKSKKKPTDKLTKELHLRGMTPQYPFDGGGSE